VLDGKLEDLLLGLVAHFVRGGAGDRGLAQEGLKDLRSRTPLALVELGSRVYIPKCFETSCICRGNGKCVPYELGC